MAFGNIFMAGVCWFCAIIFGSMALWAHKRKTPMHFWSGSKVHPDEITDIPAYNRENAMMWGAYAAFMVVAGLASLFNSTVGIALLLIALLPGIIVLMFVYRRIYNKYKNPSFIKEYRPLNSKTSKFMVKLSIAGALVVLIAVCALFYYGEKEPEVVIHDNSLKIKAMYGLEVDFAEIENVSLIEDNMTSIGADIRTNGFRGFGQALKGHFYSDRAGHTLLFVQAKSSPTIRIERTDKKDIYISFSDSEETERLFRELRRRRHIS
jgi:uncharacterized protein YneF (UPF0154 family)